MKVKFEFSVPPIKYENGDVESEIDNLNKSILSKVSRPIELPYQPQIGMLISVSYYKNIFDFTDKEAEYLSEYIYKVSQIYMEPDYLTLIISYDK